MRPTNKRVMLQRIGLTGGGSKQAHRQIQIVSIYSCLCPHEYSIRRQLAMFLAATIYALAVPLCRLTPQKLRFGPSLEPS